MIGLSPFLIYYITQYIYYQKVELTDIQSIKLVNVKRHNKKFVGFCVVLKINRQKKNLDTKPVFSNLKYASTFIEPYIESKALVGYNAKRDEAVVIRIE